ncbi:TonB-dependent receptor [Pseudoalteromonas sp. APC 3358]|uniref:TonB-dependent receptor n=1 Tax=Pseudoalteromonas TaxID=53246 RepID=UPI000C325B09|nr:MULTISPECIES: TonB-dependent receptor [Pseudoalteromonas]MBG9991796.1 TonB-dependent receptor [Pseudoalteromonas sp. NZS37]MBG9997559.1 TonB-dependent receptor [Pseudoalteromonas sp. NSLLW24]MBH0034823.1 TonB-dependent receptor [Pseudoalteromonas sp. NZS71_1]MDN3383541.1 TonB-dependent receptor [Pseudoalteromonas sp. APC 3358]PKG68104.1 TonB-dependent receptor [Pseudoalteromonas arctica]
MFKTKALSNAIRYSLLLGSVALAPNALAQENDLNSDVELEEEAPERIVVTGSRIRKAEFSNASPIQIINGDLSREMGLFDAGSMLQSTSQAAGAQIDNTFGGFVLDNGPGAATIGFRGLGAERTLVLINGRRMAPAGVGGAPTSPDLNLIPGVMIERVENLFDGASTVYGSDAVAGVANVILKKDVEGFIFDASYRQPKGEGGEETVLSGMWGKTMDNGFITVGVEYSEQKSQSLSGNPFVKGCEERIWEAEDGSIVTRNSGYGPVASGEDSCDIFPLTNRISVPSFFGSVYYTPNFTNTGIPNFSESTVPSSLEGFLPSWVAGDFDGDGINDGVFVDGNGDGFRDVDFQDPLYAFQQSDYYKSGDYRSKNERISLMLNGEYNFQDDNDTTFYYEGLYASRKSPIFSPGAQIFQQVAASNPYNPCGTNGIDCFGVLGVGPGGPEAVQPIINIRGDRDQTEVEVSQYRLVTGVTGNLGMFENIGLDNWYYDASVSYSASKGTDHRVGIDEERLINSLETAVLNDDGTVTCGTGSDGCVPVNLFADSIYQEGGGTLSPEEAAYLFIDRDIETKVNQFVFNAFMGGDFFALPWNNETVAGIVGIEYRRDEIESNPNAAASQGLLWGYFADQGADGSRNLKEIFTEVDFPLLKGVKGAEELTFTASGRVSEESFYDAESTYSLKTIYRPVDWFTLRATKGTSYRAPNLRERFLNGTSGFNTVADPCVVPEDARNIDPLNPGSAATYNAAEETRDTAVLNACQASGIDPTTLGLGQGGTDSYTATYSAEIETGGTTELSAETSVAKTYGFIFEQPFTDAFDLTMSLTRFDIEVTNSIAEPSAFYSIGQCYSADGNDAFCSRIGRDENGQIDLVDASFINIGLISSKGFDYNIYFETDTVIAEENLGITLDLQATRMTEQVFDVLGTIDDNMGEPDSPEWRGTARLQLKYSDFRFNWETRFIGKGREDEDDLGEFEEGTAGCRGLTDANGAPLKCRPVGFTDDYFVHNIGMTWSNDAYKVNFGVRNVFNEAPPKVDPNGSFSNTNIPLGVGYDTSGRSPYISFTASF